MIRLILTVGLLMLILSGCMTPKINDAESNNPAVTESENNMMTSTETETENNVAQEVQTPISVEEKNITDEQRAMQAAQQLVDSIKSKDAQTIMQLLNASASSPLDLEGVNAIIEGFGSNFDLDTLSLQVNDQGLSMDPESGQYEFALVDKNFEAYNEENKLVIRYDNGASFYHNPYLNYFPHAEKMVLQYIELISTEQTAQLASFLNADDIIVPESVADEVIQNYKELFNSGNMSVRYLNHFTFVIENSEGIEHDIEVMYGDGLMSINDKLIPEFKA